MTPAVRALRSAGVEVRPRLYDYVEGGGTARSAEALGVDEHSVVKTLVMEDEEKNPLVVLMHGDRSVSTKNLARHLGVKLVRPCDPKVAQRHSGYQVGGTSPMGLRRAMPVYMERTIADLPRLYINGGKRGFLVELTGAELVALVEPEPVDVAV